MTAKTQKQRNTASLKDIAVTYFGYAKGIRRWIALSMILLCVDGVLQAAIPGLLGYIVEKLTIDPHRFVHNRLPTLAILTAIGCVLFYVAAASQHYLNAKINSTVVIRMQADLYRHLQQLSADFFQRTRVGEINRRLTGDVSTGLGSFYSSSAYIVWALALLIPAFTTMIRLNIILFIVFLIVSAIFVVITRSILPLLRKMQRRVADQSGRISSRVTEDFSAVNLIRAYAQEPKFSDKVRSLYDRQLQMMLKTTWVTLRFTYFVHTFLLFLAPLTLLLVGAVFVSDGKLTVGGLVAFYGYWKLASGPISSLINQAASMIASLSSFDRVQEFFRETPLVQDAPNARPIKVTGGTVEFKDVVFQYPVGEGDIVLDGLTFTAEAKKSLAVVGESGAGKTTLVQLVLRFYDPLEGTILIDGQDISRVTQESLRNQIGFVMQDTILLSGTIRYNMQLAMPNSSDSEIIQALKDAEAWSFIEELPNRLDTVMGENGAQLSGGQRQRLSIARVFLKNPPIVIFDEATSALDTITERKIQETMERLYQGRTSIVIAHRLSTIIGCDRIMLLDKGRVLATGTHQELLESCEEYQDLCSKQRI